MKKHNILFAFTLFNAVMLFLNFESKAADFYHHYSTRILASNNTCTEEAQNLKQRFIHLVNKNLNKLDPIPENISTDCLGEVSFTESNQNYKLYDLSLDYITHSTDIPSYSAHYSYSSMDSEPDSGGQGIYPTFAQCQADKDFQSKEFVTQTGLEILSSSCEENNIIGTGKAYSLLIDSIGTPKAKLFQFTFENFNSVNAELQKTIHNIIVNANGESINWYKNTIFYFAPNNIRFQELVAGRMNLTECQVQLKHFQEFLNKQNKVPNYASCVPLDANPEIVLLSGVISSYSLFIIEDDFRTKKFYTFNECMSVKAHVDSHSDGTSFCSRDLFEFNKYVINRITSHSFVTYVEK